MARWGDVAVCQPIPKQIRSLDQLIRTRARLTPNAGCIVSIDGSVLTWQGLLQQLEHTSRALRALSLDSDARVALVLANGPALATAFLTVAACAACAPLNPAYSEDEFAFFLKDLDAQALIIATDVAVPARGAAARMRIPIVELTSELPALGRFSLAHQNSTNDGVGTVNPDKVALFLYTSGTTSRPKLVPLTHGNLLSSARDMVDTLELSAADRCLNLMPLFHIHGLIGGLLAPLTAGGSAICPPNFRPDSFFSWLDKTNPSWVTAVPTMHRAIVAESSRNRHVISRRQLRFIRSSSAPLPINLSNELSRAFNAPVIEAYSMTEAAHQMTCNPLPPAKQKPGTVGRPAGPEVAIFDKLGRPTPTGLSGEIVIRGPSVMRGYQDNPSANAEAFVNGWFRTGDEGWFDPDGYLVLSGRLKEQINRGGEKISPLEIDQILLSHPDVLEAAAYSFPHPTLGEEIAAVVVLRPAIKTTPTELQTFLRGKLAPFKIPRRISIVDRIPKGPTGKIQRRHLDKLLIEKLGRNGGSASQSEKQSVGIELQLLQLWRKMLNSNSIGLDDDFFEKGGDSLSALRMLLEVEKIVEHSVPETILYECSTVRQLAKLVSEVRSSRVTPLVHVQPRGTLPPFFFFHGDYGGGYYTRRLASLLDPNQPFISVIPHGVAQECLPQSIQQMAKQRVALVLATQRQGPYRLGGYCNGGLVALEVARLLIDAGKNVELVALIDSPVLNLRPTARRVYQLIDHALCVFDDSWERNHPRLARSVDALWREQNNLERLSFDSLLRHARLAGGEIKGKVLGLFGKDGTSRRVGPPRGQMPAELGSRERQFLGGYTRLYRHYVPKSVDAPVVYFSAGYRRGGIGHLGPTAEFVSVPGGHWGCVTYCLHVLGAHLRSRLDRLSP